MQGNLPQKISDINDEDSKWPHNYRKSRANVPHLEKVHSNLRLQLKRNPEDKMEDLDVNTLKRGMFMIVTRQAVVHLGNDYLENLHATNKQPQRTVTQIVRCDEKVGQGSERKSRYIHDRLARKFLEKDDSVD